MALIAYKYFSNTLNKRLTCACGIGLKFVHADSLVINKDCMHYELIIVYYSYLQQPVSNSKQ